MDDLYQEFMEICAYAPEEMTTELPRVKETFNRMRLGEEDIMRGKERLLRYFQCDLEAMRMVAGEWIRTSVDMVLAKDDGKFRMWVELPMTYLSALLNAASGVRSDILVGFPSAKLIYLFSGIFRRMDLLQDYSEARWFPPDGAHCGCTKARISMRALGIVPRSNFTFSTGTYCDEAPKIDEVVEDMFDERVFYLNRPQDDSLYERRPNPRALAHLRENIEALRQELCDAVGGEVTEEMIRNQVKHYLKVSVKTRDIGELRASADPQPLGEAAWILARRLASFTVGDLYFERRMKVLDTLQRDIQGMIDRGEGVVPKGAPKIMTVICSPTSIPETSQQLEQAGINISCQEDYAGFPIPLEDMVNAVDALPTSELFALMWLENNLVYVDERIENIVKGYKKGSLDGILLYAYYACRVFGSDFMMLRDGIKKAVGQDVPVMVVDSDYWDYRFFGPEQLKNRIDAFAEVVHMHKQRGGPC